MKELLSVSDIAVDGFIEYSSGFSLFLHQVMLLFVYQPEFKTYELFAHALVAGLIPLCNHHVVESIPLQESSCQSLAFDSYMHKIPSLAFYERFLIIVSLSANRAKLLSNALVALKSLKVLQTGPMINMAARQNALILELQIFVANWTGLVHLGSREKVLFDPTPLVLAERLLGFVDKTKALC